MATTKTIVLVEPIEGVDGAKINEVVMRAPKYDDLFQLGDVQAYAANQDGSMVFSTDNSETVRRYIERLVVEPKQVGLLAQCSLVDSIALRDAVVGFFTDARKALSTSASTSSSSGSAS